MDRMRGNLTHPVVHVSVKAANGIEQDPGTGQAGTGLEAEVHQQQLLVEEVG